MICCLTVPSYGSLLHTAKEKFPFFPSELVQKFLLKFASHSGEKAVISPIVGIIHYIHYTVPHYRYTGTVPHHSPGTVVLPP